MCGQEGLDAARASCTQRRPKETFKEAQVRLANGPAQGRGRTANGADCDTNNPTSLKEARVTAQVACA